MPSSTEHPRSTSSSPPPPPPPPINPRYLLHATGLIFLAAASSPLSQFRLAPVYGAIPASQFHHLATHVLALLAFTRPISFAPLIPDQTLLYLQAFACWIPTLQSFLLKYSTRLGPSLGPVVTESLTFYPLLFLTAYCASSLFANANVDTHVHRALSGTPLGLLAYFVFTLAQAYSSSIITCITSLSSHLAHTTIQLIIGAAYFLLAPSKLYIATLVPLLQVLLFDTHSVHPIATSIMNSSLHTHNWSLLDRRDSVSGYVSILENLDLRYRVMRCDHSLLGGEFWVDDQRREEGITVPEPIYAVFAMLEAVRLIEGSGQARPDDDKNALVIGLGIGTAPKAFIAHGIATTVVEFDPVIYEFATKHFAFPSNHTAVIKDAVAWVQATACGNQTYDYIIHDVFTGGAEPLALFTLEFLENLKSLLSETGAIALNYAGDLSSPSTRLVINTINTVFKHQCRMYRDQAPLDSDSGSEADFLNMVIFCTRTAGLEIKFRKPVTADFLESRSRQHYLLPRPELELKFPTEQDMDADQPKILKDTDVKRLERTQLDGAKRHWAIMRTVMPDFVWENY